MSNMSQYTFYVYITRIEEIDRFCRTEEVVKNYKNFNIENIQLRNQGMPKMKNKWDDGNICTTGGLYNAWNGYDDWGSNYWMLNYAKALPYYDSSAEGFSDVEELPNKADFKTEFNIKDDILPMVPNIDITKQFVTYRSMEIESTNMKYVAPNTANYSGKNATICYNPDIKVTSYNNWYSIVDRKFRTEFNPEKSEERPIIAADSALADYSWNGLNDTGIEVKATGNSKGGDCMLEAQMDMQWFPYTEATIGWTDSRPEMTVVNSYKTYGIGCRYFFSPLYCVFNDNTNNSLQNYVPGYSFSLKNTLPPYNYGCYRSEPSCWNDDNKDMSICGSKYIDSEYENSPYGCTNGGGTTQEVYNPLNELFWDGTIPFKTYNYPTPNIIAAKPNRICSGITCDVNIRYFLCSYVGGKSGDILYQSDIAFKIPVHELNPYTQAPTIVGNQYVNTFSDSNFKFGYYDYGYFSNPTVYIISSEMESQNTSTPSALYAIQYNLSESDFLQDDILPQIFDLLNVFDRIYGYTNPVYSQATFSTNYEVNSVPYRSYYNKDGPLTYDPNDPYKNKTTQIVEPLYTITSNLENVENNYQQYYLASLDAAKRLIADYCTYSNNMASELCSGQIYFPNLGITESPCIADYSDCNIGWTKFCTDSNNYNTEACLNYFSSGYLPNGIMSNDMQNELRTVCANVYYNSDPNDLENTNFYDICGCYLPNEVYEDFQKELITTGQSVGSAQCWFMPCTQSNYAITNPLYLECPDTSVATCVQKSYVNLQAENADIKNNTIIVNQVIKECTAQISKDEQDDKPTETPIDYQYENVSVKSADFTEPTQVIPFYPTGFCITVVLVFFTCVILIIVFA